MGAGVSSQRAIEEDIESVAGPKGEALMLLLTGLIARLYDVPAEGGTVEQRRKRAHALVQADRLAKATRESAPELSLKLQRAPGVVEKRALAVSTLRELSRSARAGVGDRLMVELVGSPLWPEGMRWEGRSSTIIAVALQGADPSVGPSRVKLAELEIRRAYTRLSRASVSTGTKTLLAIGSIAVTFVSAGVAAPALATAIGGAMGLSGAAATSAGLAFLGGGSLASGGFGMAGGILLVKVSAAAAYRGSRYVATGVAGASRRSFIREVAKLHAVAALRFEEDPQSRAHLVDELHLMMRDIEGVLGATPATASPRIPRAESKRLRAALRVLKAEISYLTESSWARRKRTVRRWASPLMDDLSDRQDRC